MNVVTVTRQYGAGGYEVARGLAQRLGWELLDRELLHRAAAVEHLSDAELERFDEKAIRLTDRLRLHPPHQQYIHGLGEAARQAASKGNVVLVGRGTGLLLADLPNVFHLRLVADRAWRARRMARQESWSYEHALARCTEEDRIRGRFVHYFFGAEALEPARYHLIVNTGRVSLEETFRWVAAALRSEWPEAPSAPVHLRALTLSRELGAGDTGFAPTLAGRLGLRVYDRELLEQLAARLHVRQDELERIDEQPSGIFQRLRSGSLPQRYFDAMGEIMRERAQRGGVLIVGRGGSQFLRDEPGTFHVRLVAPMSIRVRRVMEHRWLREAPARNLITESDARRQRFCQDYFGADWSNPLEYHITVNSGRLGPAAVDLIALAASS